jgi:murein DD-endopeptidase MepM/ murein hydrolase activator NlpD
MFRRREKSEYSVINFERSAPKVHAVRHSLRRVKALASSRLHTAVGMTRLFFAHQARRNSFILKAHQIIFTKITLPTIQKTAKAKASEGYSSVHNSAFARRLEADAQVACVKTRRLAGKAAPHVRANALAVTIGTIAVCGILLISTVIAGDVTYYEYSYGGKVLGVVKNEGEVYGAVSRPEAKKAIDERAGAHVILGGITTGGASAGGSGDSNNTDVVGVSNAGNEGISVKKVIKIEPAGVNVDDEDAIIANIAELDEVNVVGRAITVGGKSLATLGSEKAANELLSRVKDRWLGGRPAESYKEVSFVGGAAQTSVETEKLNIESVSEVYSRLESTSFEAIRVKTVEAVNYEEEYRAKPVYINEKNRYEDYKSIVTRGAVGQRRVAADLVRINGEVAGQRPTSYEVLRPATPSYIIRGTKKLPKAVGNGMFVRPAVGGIVTSTFGPRWGGMHKGIDINVKYAPIYAAKDGIIVYTGNKGDGYGIKVVIDHGDGYETLYGHLSESFVKVGEEVYKGQHIATSGNTGNSTGPHIHFEVRVGGVPRNPLYYM